MQLKQSVKIHKAKSITERKVGKSTIIVDFSISSLTSGGTSRQI